MRTISVEGRNHLWFDHLSSRCTTQIAFRARVHDRKLRALECKRLIRRGLTLTGSIEVQHEGRRTAVIDRPQRGKYSVGTFALRKRCEAFYLTPIRIATTADSSVAG